MTVDISYELVVIGTNYRMVSEEERQFVRQLIGMANNLNQLTKNSYQKGMLRTMLYFESFRNQIDVLLKKLDHGK